ncbi:hypothetical protein JL722_12548 [Aureococcus anophagefferens]|nr:hypothetical protein JL722_12548 [Aureococcus anophagefferens]
MGDWIEAVDPTHQQPYWYSPSLNESTWERPALALHWTAQIDDAGHTYYYHVETGESRWEPPYALTVPAPEPDPEQEVPAPEVFSEPEAPPAAPPAEEDFGRGAPPPAPVGGEFLVNEEDIAVDITQRSGAFGGRVAEDRSVLVDEEDVAVDVTQRSGAFGGRVAEDHSAFRGYRAEPRPDPEPEPEPAPATIERAARGGVELGDVAPAPPERRRSLVDAAHPHLNPTQLDHLDLDPSIRRTTKGKAFTKPKQVYCHLCGREFGTASLRIHAKACLRKLEATQRDLPKARRTRPPRPPDEDLFPLPTSSDGEVEFFAYNVEALRIFGEISGDASRLRALLAESEGRKRDEDAEERAREDAEAERRRGEALEAEARRRAALDAEAEAEAEAARLDDLALERARRERANERRRRGARRTRGSEEGRREADRLEAERLLLEEERDRAAVAARTREAKAAADEDRGGGDGGAAAIRDAADRERLRLEGEREAERLRLASLRVATDEEARLGGCASPESRAAEAARRVRGERMRDRGYRPLRKGDGRRAAENGKLADELRHEAEANKTTRRARESILRHREIIAGLDAEARDLHYREWDPQSHVDTTWAKSYAR